MKNKIYVAQFAPAARVSIGEEFGMKPGTLVTGKLVAALRKIGFDYVFDTQFGADMAVMEEGTEFLERVENSKNIPLFSSCCPAWVHFMENSYPGLSGHLSTVKSPQQIVGALVKTYWAKKEQIDPSRIRMVSIMPCIVKKLEKDKAGINSAYKYWNEYEDYQGNQFADVDEVLTVHELAQYFKDHQVDFKNLEDSDLDKVLGYTSGAGTIFGTKGGVMEAMLRTVANLNNQNGLGKIVFEQVRELGSAKSTTIEINGKKINLAVVDQIGDAKKILESIKNEQCDYQVVEVMACKGGCIGGAGQPRCEDKDVLELRRKGLFANDEQMEVRMSHKNTYVQKVYDEFLERPYSEKAKLLLHLER